MNWYEERLERRRERLEARAEKARNEGESRVRASNAAVAGIPLGQPILVGHHSEGRHRAALKRSRNHMDKGCEAFAKAKALDARAAAVGRGGVSSLDPDASDKLRAKLEKAERFQGLMKSVNAIVRRAPKNQRTPEKVADLVALGVSDTTAEKLFVPDYCGQVGFPGYALSNNSAEIRRLKARLENVEQKQNLTARPVRRIGEIEIRDNTEFQKVELYFPEKPAPTVIDFLKANGFRWIRSAGCWARSIDNATEWRLAKLAELIGQPIREEGQA